jgi:hypothetical protein
MSERNINNVRNKIPSLYSLNYPTTVGSLLCTDYILEAMGDRKRLANIHSGGSQKP